MTSEKCKEERLRAISTCHAVAGAFGSLGTKELNEYLDSLYSKPKDNIDSALQEMKQMGLPVED